MNQLPHHSTLEMGKLSSIFGNTTNSYKFYWFLAILDSIKENENPLIHTNELALRMVANVWYPLDYYKLSFGKQDSFKEIASNVSSLYEVDNSIKSKSLFEQINTILCFYVLNVLLPEQQAQVMMKVLNLLKPTGKAYFSVRRDISEDVYRNHFKHQKPTYQCNVILPFKSIFKNENTEIYEYQHYNQLELKKSDCSFCSVTKEKELIAEMVSCYAIYDKNQVLIIPKRHVASYFDLTFREQTAYTLMLNFVTKLLKKRLSKQSCNIEIKIGVTIEHSSLSATFY
jgi:diadenosine tetraphosphate (Ap4A) HIT family hydrolase